MNWCLKKKLKKTKYLTRRQFKIQPMSPITYFASSDTQCVIALVSIDLRMYRLLLMKKKAFLEAIVIVQTEKYIFDTAYLTMTIYRVNN